MSGMRKVCRRVTFPLEMAQGEDQRIKDCPKHQAEGRGPCSGVPGSHGRAVSRGGEGKLWV